MDAVAPVKEPFSWSKFFSGFMSGVGYAKAIAITLRIILVLCVPASYALAYHFGSKSGNAKGQLTMAAIKDKEFKQWMADHPQNVVNGDGTQLNNNVQKPNNHFQASVFPFRIGWCE